MQLFVQPKAPIEGTFVQLLRRANPGDRILLYDGPWDEWQSHPKGVIIRRGNRFLLNGTELLCDEPWDEWQSHPKGVIIRRGNRFLLNGTKLLFEGRSFSWQAHTNGMVFPQGNQFVLVVG